MWQASGGIFSDGYEPARFREMPDVKALTFWQQLVKAGHVPLEALGDGLERKQYAMVIASCAWLGRYVAALGDDLGGRTTAVPKEVRDRGGRRQPCHPGEVQAAQETWKFIRWMSNPQVNLR